MATQPILNRLFSLRCAPIFYFLFLSSAKTNFPMKPCAVLAHQRTLAATSTGVCKAWETCTYNWEYTTSMLAEANTANPLLELPFFLSGPMLHLVCPHHYRYAPSSHVQPKYLTPSCPFSTQKKLHSTWSVGTAHGPSPNLWMQSKAAVQQ